MNETAPSTPAGSDEPEGSDDPEVMRVHAALLSRFGFGDEVAGAARIGRFAVLDRLGAGAMGVVYRGYDDSLERPIALKLLHAELDEAVRDRLFREARWMAKLSSPHVATVFEVGEHRGRGFVAMELIRGETLRARFAGGARTWREVVDAYRQVAMGLAAAHAAGVVHRDFKPDNAMIDGAGAVKVLDFGLARAEAIDPSDVTADPDASLPSGAADPTPLTRTGALVGTPAYMAPEQLAGGQATAASDQFALCVAMFEALTGARPFGGKTTAALAAAIRTGAPRLPSDRAPAWIERIVARGLHADPAARWPSVAALAEALARDPSRRRTVALVVGGTASLLAAVSAWQHFDRQRALAACERNGEEVAAVWSPERAAAISEAFAATGLPYASSAAERVAPWLDERAAELAKTATAACVAHDVERTWTADQRDRASWCVDERSAQLGAVIDELARADGDLVASAIERVARLERGDDCSDPAVLALRRAPDPQLRPAVTELRRALAEAAAEPDRAAALVQVDAALVDAQEIGWRPGIARVQQARAAALDRLARFDDAYQARAAAYFEAARADAWELAFESAVSLVRLAGDRLARPDDALGWARHAEVALDHAGDPGELRRAELDEAIGRTHMRAGRFAEARDALQRAADLRAGAFGPGHPSLARDYTNLGIVIGEMGELERSSALFQRSLDVLLAVHGEDHPDVATSLFHLATTQPDVAIAEQQMLRSIAISERTLGAEHPDVGQGLSNLGFLLYSSFQTARARPVLERALAIREAALGPDHPDLGSTLNSLASVYFEQGEEARAIELYQRALANARRARGPDHPEVAHVLGNLAAVTYAGGDKRGGMAIYEESLGIFERAYDVHHPQVAATVFTLAMAHHELGEVARAWELSQRAWSIYERQASAEPQEADARFLHARLLLEHVGDAAAACAESVRAREHFVDLGPGRADALAEVDAWRAKHCAAQGPAPAR